MATDVSSLPVNGSHGPVSGFEGGYAASQASYTQPTSTSTQSQAASSGPDIPKDEVGWYFVEQYYTTLSRSPEKLYLFYNKRSQFVLGDETDKVAVCVGQKAINERIKDLDFQDCKVRVTNVDSQASDSNIVIQVIGEISNKSQPHKKFVQTFILAGQTNGYFVLNDIFRYLVEEEEEETQDQEAPVAAETGYQEPAPTATETVSETLTSSANPAEVEQSAQLVDQELETKAAPEIPSADAGVNGTTESPAQAEEPAASTPPVEAAAPSPAPAAEPEKPKETVPAPAASPAKKPATPAAAPSAPAPAKPSAPKTWANLAAAAHRVVTPAVPASQPAASTPPTQPKAATSASQPTSQPAPAAETAAPRDTSPPADEQDEWTSVGGHGRQQSRAQTGAAPQEGPQSRGYIKNVTDTVDAKQLRSLLEKFGEIVYFDISRQKNCAFVDFKTPEGYQAAVAANPHQLGNERIVVEERRLKPGSYPYVPRGGMRGGRGAPNQGPNRGSFQGGRGGGYGGRGRGGATGSPRGRGGQGS
ncbi:Nuclear transport factor 2 (NTF2) domain-containing protein [Elsinoe fawcettii]|nr:Nuclear transport factor 2 (NTF2) domain-containing protein [Elsinoe fawcettii]